MDTMSPMVGRVSAYFAPVNRTAQQATIFDAAQNGGFALNSPPSPWLGLGWITGFTRKCGTKIEPVRAGSPAVAQMQSRTEIEATVSFAFESWGKLQLALSAGTQQMNLLRVAPGSTDEGSGGTAISAVPLQAGSTASVLQVGATAASGFSVGELIAVDIDYGTQTGFVGSGVSGAYVQTALSDVDYIRRVTLNVGRITAINAATGALTLQWPLIAGAPDCDDEGQRRSRVLRSRGFELLPGVVCGVRGRRTTRRASDLALSAAASDGWCGRGECEGWRWIRKDSAQRGRSGRYR